MLSRAQHWLQGLPSSPSTKQSSDGSVDETEAVAPLEAKASIVESEVVEVPVSLETEVGMLRNQNEALKRELRALKARLDGGAAGDEQSAQEPNKNTCIQS